MGVMVIIKIIIMICRSVTRHLCWVLCLDYLGLITLEVSITIIPILQMRKWRLCQI